MMRVRMGLRINMTVSVTWKVRVSQDSDEVRRKEAENKGRYEGDGKDKSDVDDEGDSAGAD
jgi:hypothetical protein